METVALINASSGNESVAKKDSEMKNLLSSLQLHVTHSFFQELKEIHKTTYIGSGKLQEIAAFLQNEPASALVCNFDLTPLQFRTLTDVLHLPVFDRTGIILEIFSRNARTKEAQLQIEIARMEYEKSRLVRTHASYEQISSGSGVRSRGSGEKQIDLDRRRYRLLLTQKTKELETLVRQRKTMREKRNLHGLPRLSIVGYTNAGKSTLMNALMKESGKQSHKLVLEEDRLFATLETSTRLIEIDGYPSFLITDTVGFIDDLPTMLVKAFRSTLEEITESDLLVQVVDVSDPDYLREIEVTEQTLKAIGVGEIPMVYLYNKFDRIDTIPLSVDDRSLFTSLKDHRCLKDILELCFSQLCFSWIFADLFLPFECNLYEFKKASYIVRMQEEETGYRIQAYLTPQSFAKYRRYQIESPQES